MQMPLFHAPHRTLRQELEAAERALADACDEVDKAERFFPVPGGADAAATPRSAAGAPEAAMEAWSNTPGLTVHWPP